MRAPAPAPGRLTRDARRDQLLDSAASLLVDRGVAALTMEGVAARAGVSKALPYTHFENADDLLRALRSRELDRVGEAVVDAVRAASGLEARVAASIHAYFDAIHARGAVLEIVLRAAPGDARSSPDREDLAFFATLFERHAGLSAPLARVASSVFVAGVAGAVDCWVRRVATRATIEAALVRLVMAGVHALAEDEVAGRLPIRRHAAAVAGPARQPRPKRSS